MSSSPSRTQLKEDGDGDQRRPATVELTPQDELDDALESERTRSSGPPIVTIKTGSAGHVQSAYLSISHDGDYATAVCLCLPGDLGMPVR